MVEEEKEQVKVDIVRTHSTHFPTLWDNYAQ